MTRFQKLRKKISAISWRTVLLFISFFIVYVWGNTSLPVTDPTESNYALTAKEMVEAGQYFSPIIYGNFWYDKPIFYYWQLIASFSVFGITDFAARFVNACMAVCNLVLVYQFTKHQLSQKMAILATIILGTSVEFWIVSKAIITDMTLVFFMSGSLMSFFTGYTKRNANYYYLSYALSSLAVLTKGPIGLILPGLVIILFLAIRRDLKELLHLKIISGLLLFFLIGAPWYYYMYLNHGTDFIATFLGVHNYLRATVSEHPKDNVWYYYGLISLIGLFPWSFLFLGSAVKSRPKAPIISTNCDTTDTNCDTIDSKTAPTNIVNHWATRLSPSHWSPLTQFLISWALVVYVFFQCMATKYTTYTFPAFIPLTILLAIYFSQHYPPKLIHRIATCMAGIYIILSMVAIPALNNYTGRSEAQYLSQHITQDDIVVATADSFRVSTTFYSGIPVHKLYEKKRGPVDNQKISWDVKRMMPTLTYTDIPTDKNVYLITKPNQFPIELTQTDWKLVKANTVSNIYVRQKTT